MIMHDLSQENMPTEEENSLANELIFKHGNKKPTHLNQILNEDDLPSESEYSASVVSPQEAKAQAK